MHTIDRLEFVLAERGAAGFRRMTDLSEGEASLATLIELAAVRWARWRENGEDILKLLPDGGARAGLEGLASVGNGSALLSLSAAEAGSAVFPAFRNGEVSEVPVGREEWSAGRPFTLFQERFKSSLTGQGVPTEFALALVGAFTEMASNAVEHAAAPIPPVASFETSAGSWAFSVTDVGCGVVESLKRNPGYAAVADGKTALSFALADGVSGTGQPGRGTGFTTLFKALIDRDCTIRFRSAGVAAACSATSPTAGSLAFLVLPPRVGFHVAVTGDYPRARP